MNDNTTYEERLKARKAEKRRRRHAVGVADVHADNSADTESIKVAREANFAEQDKEDDSKD